MMDAITLVAKATPRGVFDAVEPSQTTVPCVVRSVTRSEAYQAKAVGLNPSIIFVLAVAEDYHGEKQIVFRGTNYRVVRTYQDGMSLEIVCEEVTYDKD